MHFSSLFLCQTAHYPYFCAVFIKTHLYDLNVALCDKCII